MRKSLALAGLAAAALVAGALVWRGGGGAQAEKSSYRVAAVERGAIIAAVKATGTLTPVSTVLVGSQLSGQVVEILADYNAEVSAGQVMARLASDQIMARRDAARADVMQGEADLMVKRARVERQRATFERAQAGTADQAAQRDRAQAQLADAKRTMDRQAELFSSGSGSRVTLDTARTQHDVAKAALASSEAQIKSASAELTGLEVDIRLAEADVKAAEAMIAQRKARLRDIEIDLERTDIKSPVQGVVVQKSVELGQTVAASLSSPVLFQVAQDLRQIEIYANVDESDVGRISEGQRATFTVTAYPARNFEGRVKQVRLGAQTIQNVVIYTAVVSVANEDRALLPGMTANLSIITEEKRDVLKIANAALRWRPAGAAATTPPPATAPPAAGAFSLDAPAGPNPFATGGNRGSGGRGEGGGGGRGGGGRAMEELRETLMAELKPDAAVLAKL
ncbi:MAG: efflux RND transporter periplasmic adaptor subunit, partial [Beijerinckiaceae bacterium]